MESVRLLRYTYYVYFLLLSSSRSIWLQQLQCWTSAPRLFIRYSMHMAFSSLCCAGTKVKLASKGRKPTFYAAGALLTSTLPVMFLALLCTLYSRAAYLDRGPHHDAYRRRLLLVSLSSHCSFYLPKAMTPMLFAVLNVFQQALLQASVTRS